MFLRKKANATFNYFQTPFASRLQNSLQACQLWAYVCCLSIFVWISRLIVDESNNYLICNFTFKRPGSIYFPVKCTRHKMCRSLRSLRHNVWSTDPSQYAVRFAQYRIFLTTKIDLRTHLCISSLNRGSNTCHLGYLLANQLSIL